MDCLQIQKYISPLHILAYDSPADAIDEYTCIFESTTIEALNKFCAAIVNVFEQHYLRPPNLSNVVVFLAFNTLRFPGYAGKH